MALAISPLGVALPDPGPNSTDPAADLAGSFAVLLLGLQQQALPADLLPTALALPDAPEAVEAVARPAGDGVATPQKAAMTLTPAPSGPDSVTGDALLALAPEQADAAVTAAATEAEQPPAEAPALPSPMPALDTAWSATPARRASVPAVPPAAPDASGRDATSAPTVRAPRPQVQPHAASATATAPRADATTRSAVPVGAFADATPASGPGTAPMAAPMTALPAALTAAVATRATVVATAPVSPDRPSRVATPDAIAVPTLERSDGGPAASVPTSITPSTTAMAATAPVTAEAAPAEPTLPLAPPRPDAQPEREAATSRTSSPPAPIVAEMAAPATPERPRASRQRTAETPRTDSVAPLAPPADTARTTDADLPPVTRTREAAELRQAPAEPEPEPVTRLRMELTPPLMGEVVLEVRHDGRSVSAHAVVEQAATGQVLRQVETQVQQFLSDHGLQAGSFEVSTRDGGGSGRQQPEYQPPAAPRLPVPDNTITPSRPVATRARADSAVDLYA